MYQLSRTVPVNEPKKSFLSRHDVWTGLMMKANNALPYVPEMKKCDVVEQGDGSLIPATSCSRRCRFVKR